jgi:hypothetical protein
MVMMPMTSGTLMGGSGVGGSMQVRQIKVVGYPNPSSSFMPQPWVYTLRNCIGRAGQQNEVCPQGGLSTEQLPSSSHLLSRTSSATDATISLKVPGFKKEDVKLDIDEDK